MLCRHSVATEVMREQGQQSGEGQPLRGSTSQGDPPRRQCANGRKHECAFEKATEPVAARIGLAATSKAAPGGLPRRDGSKNLCAGSLLKTTDKTDGRPSTRTPHVCPPNTARKDPVNNHACHGETAAPVARRTDRHGRSLCSKIQIRLQPSSSDFSLPG